MPPTAKSTSWGMSYARCVGRIGNPTYVPRRASKMLALRATPIRRRRLCTSEVWAAALAIHPQAR